MFGKRFTVDLEADSHQLLYIVDDFLKKNGISYINQVEPEHLRGYGDAGMGIFEIEKRRDRERQLKLYVDTNSPMSAQILENLILNVLEHMEENDLYDKPEEKEGTKEGSDLTEDKEELGRCDHDYSLLKEDSFLGLEIELYLCKKCNKIEIYKKED